MSFAAWSQTQPAKTNKSAGSTQNDSGVSVGQQNNNISVLPHDAQFLALVRARDGRIAVIGELKRITTFHDNFRSRIDRLLLSTATNQTSREQVISRIEIETARLKKFEDDVNAAGQLSIKTGLAKKFDSEFPVTSSESPFRRPSRPSDFRSLSFESDRSLFVQRERANANEVFQNVSNENRELLPRYDKLFANIESGLAEAVIKVSRLDKLPAQFNELAGAPSFEELTESQIQTGIAQYREALQASRNDLAAAPPSPSPESLRVKLMAQVDAVGAELLTRTSDQYAESRELEKGISNAAKSLYGNKVGADSFNYLLIVFAAVFFAIMIMPRFYPEAVAANVLKSEFLLQFSTVFVLVAAIIILAIGELIAKDQLPVLLAGISGYVLGQLGKV
ncbi:MAG: hypothetical protein JWR80_2878 [Bradyrhizobium sp.]|nr:hypothetical protein [Bradyrhizobium sp.]